MTTEAHPSPLLHIWVGADQVVEDDMPPVTVGERIQWPLVAWNAERAALLHTVYPEPKLRVDYSYYHYDPPQQPCAHVDGVIEDMAHLQWTYQPRNGDTPNSGQLSKVERMSNWPTSPSAYILLVRTEPTHPSGIQP